MSDEKDSSSQEPGDTSEEATARRETEDLAEAEGEERAAAKEEDEESPNEDELWDETFGPASEAEDELDPELLALGEEKEKGIKWHRPAIMTIVCLLIVVMMVWFHQDLLYFFTPSEPVDLGEAHDITFDESWENRYVRFQGFPLAPSVTSDDPRCGRHQGFPTYQRRALCRGHQSAIPLAGRESHDLIVQRYLIRQLRVFYTVPEGREAEALEQAALVTRRVSAVQSVQPTKEGELGDLIAEIEGTPGRTDIDAVAKAIKYEIESKVPGATRVQVERVRRDPPGAFEGRLMRIDDLGSRFAAVAEFLNECTNFDVDEDTWVVLDGSEAGTDPWDGAGLCYGQAPQQYWPYLVLYILLGAMLILNVYLLARFFLKLRRSR